MEVLDQHQVTDDPQQSTDWTTIGTRILEAATLATAIHLEELGLEPRRSACLQSERSRSDREIFDGMG